MNKFYVYVYLDPRKIGKYVYGTYEFDFLPFYVGKGMGTRMYQHSCLSRLKNTKTKKRALLRGILNDGLRPIIIKIEKNLTEEESFVLEKKLIDLIGRFDMGLGPLCNLTNGGDGISGAICSEERKKKISEALKNKPKTKEHNKKVSEALKNKPKTKEHRENLKKSLIDFFSKNEHPASIKVINIDTNEIFNSIHKAAESLENGSPSHILYCCRGIRKTHKGCRWQFLSEFEKNKLNK
jgi:hypothetical protein